MRTCQELGVCQARHCIDCPMPRVRVLARKLLVLQGDEDDYTLHCSLVTAAARRNVVAEALQKDLEQRFSLDVRNAARAKCRESLMTWWRNRAAQGEIAGALWATLTHARCDEWLEMRVLGQVHMLQHQVGAAQRVDLAAHLRSCGCSPASAFRWSPCPRLPPRSRSHAGRQMPRDWQAGNDICFG